MTNKIWYESSADKPEYVYFQYFPDMAAVKYHFGELHIHQSVEILVVCDGHMRCTVNNQTEELSGGSVFIANPYDTHHYEYVGNASAYIIVVHTDYLSNILDEKTEFNNFLQPNDKTWSALMALIRTTYHDYDGFNSLQKRGFIQSLLGILYPNGLLRSKEKNNNREFFIKVSEYIANNYGEELKLPSLAKKFGYSENYFSALFNKVAGMNLNEYINRVRIRKVLESRERLEAKYTLKEIVLRCGFNSMETYYRVLKKYRGERRAEEKKMANLTEEQAEVTKAHGKKLWATVVGYGNRGQVYADYSLDCPDELGIAAVVDPNEFKLKEAQKRYGLSDDRLFKTFDDFVKSGVACDFVINATMDQNHYETAMKILAAKYDMLIEKPIVPNEEQLMAIKNLAEENGCKVFVCHVLRYTPYYRRIKRILLRGVIGKVVSMEMNERVCIAHYLTSYVRGKWNSEENCGSGFLLAKCCHDLDLMCWLNNESAPDLVSSFGCRSHFIKDNKPEGATEYCYQCPHERSCPYSAIKLYMEMNAMPFLTWDRLNKPLDEITDEEKLEFLKKDIYGKCAYDNLGDLVDRQNVIISFKNGSNCTFTLVGGSVKADRYIHIVGTMGEIEGKLEEDKFVYRRYIKEEVRYQEEIIDVSHKVVNNAVYGGHSGGDYGIMHDVVRYLNGDKASMSITLLDDSVESHLLVYAAEESRKTRKVIDL